MGDSDSEPIVDVKELVDGFEVDKIERRIEPVDFGNLLGVYHWVWNGLTNEQIKPDNGDDEWGGLTLSIKATRVALPANVTGKFLQYNYGGSFEELVPNKKAGLGTWDIKRTIWEIYEDEPPTDEEGGQLLWVSKVLDDNGQPFLGMTIEDWEETNGGRPWNMLGKRQIDGYMYDKGMKWEGLSDGEMQRLGLVADAKHNDDDDLKRVLGKRTITDLDDQEFPPPSKSKLH